MTRREAEAIARREFEAIQLTKDERRGWIGRRVRSLLAESPSKRKPAARPGGRRA